MAHICSLKNLNHTMFTITLGVQKSYKDEDFYTVNNKFASEEIRVNELFKNSKNKGEIIFINQKN